MVVVVVKEEREREEEREILGVCHTATNKQCNA